MEFDRNNNVIKLCVQCIEMKEEANPKKQAYYFFKPGTKRETTLKSLLLIILGRHQMSVRDKLKWLETSLQFALKIDDVAVKGFFLPYMQTLLKSYEDLNDLDNAKKSHQLANSFADKPVDNGPFYHTGRKLICRLAICSQQVPRLITNRNSS